VIKYLLVVESSEQIRNELWKMRFYGIYATLGCDGW